MDILRLDHVSKAFGSSRIIDDISFSVQEHSIYGFIGQNGAGKTTTMKMILGLLKADSGEIAVCGKKVSFGQNETNRYIGYLPDVPEFYDFMTPTEYLLLCGSITDMDRTGAKQRAEELLDLVGLAGMNKRIKGFSRGMKQRLGIAQALLNRPKLLICDEPTSALDPVGRREVLDILVRAREETTVIFSTHILSDVERICDQVAFLHQGRIVMQGSIEEIRAQHSGSDIEIEFHRAEDAQRFITCLEALPGHAGISEKQVQASGPRTEKQVSKIQIEKQSDADLREILQLLAEQNLCPQRIECLENSLEDLFMEVVRK